MSFNLLDSVKGLFTNDLIAKAGNVLGESENGVQRAISGVIPAVLAGILNKAGSGDAGGILNMATNAANSGILSNIGNFFGGNFLTKGTDMLKGIFGNHTDDVSNTVASYAGIKASSATSLMSLAAPAALGSLGKHAEATNMNAGGLLSFLNTQKDSILNAVPSGLNLAGALGLSGLGNIGNKLSSALTGLTGSLRDMPGRMQNAAKPSGNRWVLPLLIVLLLAVLAWYLLKPKQNDNKEAQITAPSTETPSATQPAAPAMESIKVKLPDGTEIDAYRGGIEDQLVSFLNDPSKQPDKNTWFDFDNLNFETGSSTITKESTKQVQNIAAILKAFPRASIKIGGYTDKTGDSISNLKLSQSRAEAVATALKTNGIKATQLAGAEGYGSQFAKAAADAPGDERKKDRRIAVSVREK